MPGNRHQTHGHRDVFKDLEQEYAQKSDDDQRAVQVYGVADDPCETD